MVSLQTIVFCPGRELTLEVTESLGVIYSAGILCVILACLFICPFSVLFLGVFPLEHQMTDNSGSSCNIQVNAKCLCRSCEWNWEIGKITLKNISEELLHAKIVSVSLFCSSLVSGCWCFCALYKCLGVDCHVYYICKSLAQHSLKLVDLQVLFLWAASSRAVVGGSTRCCDVQSSRQVFFLAHERVFGVGKTRCAALGCGGASLCVLTRLWEGAGASSRRMCSTQGSDGLRFLRQSCSLSSALDCWAYCWRNRLPRGNLVIFVASLEQRFCINSTNRT